MRPFDHSHDVTENVPFWLAPTHPHQMLWMEEYSVALSFYFYFAYLFYLFITGTGLVLRREHYLFRKNPLGITLCSAFMQGLLCTVHLLRFWTLTPMGTSFALWRNYVIFPLCMVFSMQAAGMHILFEVIWTKSIGNLALGKVDAASWARLSWRERMVQGIRNPRLHVFLKNKGSYLIAVFLTVMHVSMAIFIQVTHDAVEFKKVDKSIMSFGIALWVLLYMILWGPLMLFLIRNVKDAYNLRKDLQNGLSYGFPFYMLYVCVRDLSFMQPIRSEIPSFFWLTFAMFCLHTSTVTVPLIRSFFWIPEELPLDDEPGFVAGNRTTSCARVSSPHDLVISGQRPCSASAIVVPHRPIPLEKVLDNPGLSRAFEEYSKNAFVWDSVLFHRAVQHFRSVTTVDPRALREEALKIREQYIEPGAPCEMNLTYEVVRQIDLAILTDDLCSTMFDEAQSAILRLVGNCTYRNFLYTLSPSEKACYMMPVGSLMPKPSPADTSEAERPETGPYQRRRNNDSDISASETSSFDRSFTD